jgi:MFS family permease
VLSVLLLMYVFNYLDRYVLTQMIGPIKEDLGVTDTTMGFLIGPAFALFYTVCGLPIARWADVGSRRSIIAVGFAVWSLFTAASGLAKTAVQLTVMRIGVGVGEAAGAAPAHSLISDYFPPKLRATALAIFQNGVYVGSMLGLVVGGYLVDAIGWRNTLIVVGLPGLAGALLLRLTVREPPHGVFDAPPDPDEEQPGMLEVLRTLGRKPTFWLVALGAGVASFAGTGFGFWMPTFLERVHDMGRLEIGLRFGVINNVAAGCGAVLAGRIADVLGRRDVRWYAGVGAISVFMMLPFIGLTLLWPDGAQAVYWMIPSGLLGGGWAPIAYSMAQNLAPARMRATASALVILFITFLGTGLGPWAVGYLNDVLAPRYGDEAVRWSLLGVLSTCIVGALLFALAARTIRRDYGAALAEEPSH